MDQSAYRLDGDVAVVGALRPLVLVRGHLLQQHLDASPFTQMHGSA
jgi:hypothetical protein